MLELKDAFNYSGVENPQRMKQGQVKRKTREQSKAIWLHLAAILAWKTLPTTTIFNSERHGHVKKFSAKVKT